MTNMKLSTRVPGAPVEPTGEERLIADTDAVNDALDRLYEERPDLFLPDDESDDSDDGEEIDLSAYDDDQEET